MICEHPNKPIRLLEIKAAKLIQLFYLSAAIFAFPALLPSCQAPAEREAPAHRIADYFVRYLAAEQQLKAYASFYEGDSIRTATPRRIPDGVTFQGAAMEQRDLAGRGIRYTITRTSEYPQPLRFVHQDENGRRVERIFSLAPLEDFSFDGAVSRQAGATLIIEGDPLEASESLVLLFTDDRNRAYSITLPGPNPDNRFRLSSKQLAGLPVGASQLYLVRKKSEVRESPGHTTLAAMEYYTMTISVEVLP